MSNAPAPEQLELPLQGGGFPFQAGDLVQYKAEPDARWHQVAEVLTCDNDTGQVYLKHPKNVLRIGSERELVIAADQVTRYWKAP